MTEDSVKVGVEGDRGAGELGTGEGGKRELTEGGKRELTEGGKREQKSKRHSFVVYYCLSSRQKPVLPFNKAKSEIL